MTANSSSRWRLLFVVNTPWFFVMHRMPLAVEARRLGYEVHIASGSERGAEDIEAAGFTFHRLPLNREALSPFADARTLFALIALYRKVRPHIVHHITWKAIVFGTLAARFTKVPVLVNAFAGLGSAFVHPGALQSLRRILMLRLVGLAKRHGNSWSIFENQDDHRALVASGALRPDTAVVMPGIGVDTRVFKQAPEQNGPVARVVFASRMLREKGVEDLVEAARILKQRNVPASVVLVGGADRGNPSCVSPEELQAWAKEGVIEWVGFKENIQEVLRESNIVCLPTYYREGVPRILMEAAAVGRCIVTTDSPGCRDVVVDGVNGLLVPPRDVGRLADAIERLARDPALRTRFGAAGRSLVEERFEAAMVVQATMDLYEKALSATVHEQSGKHTAEKTADHSQTR